jgi:PAS domain S-box-containing protein
VVSNPSPRLKDIQEDVRRFAEAISSALRVEAEIVDNELTIIAGTGLYKDLVGQKEENGDINSGFIYGRTLKTGKPTVVSDAANDPTYDPSILNGSVLELAEICCPINLRGAALGAIGLVAFDEAQRRFLLERSHEMLEFLGRMAELLASKVAEAETLQRLVIASNQMRTILESIEQGILAIDQQGIIQHCNGVGARLMKKQPEQLIGQPIERVMPGSPLMEVVRTGRGYQRREETYQTEAFELHFLASAEPIVANNAIVGAVVSLRNISDVRKQAYEIMASDHVIGIESILGQSPQMQDLKTRVRQVAQTNATVLITGETGTGKGLIAGAIHYSGSRRSGPFISVNCAAIPDELLESELFGYMEGAFSGARKGGKPGKFELANSGTIYLDEIGDLPLRLQPKLLHVLQARTVERLGGVKPIKVDVRVIASTNQDLEQMIAEREFREDLYYRLNVIPLTTPPFRERQQDILLLLESFLQKRCRDEKKQIKGISPEVAELFLAYDWPGNVRELENAVEYMVSLERSEVITLDSVPSRIKKACEFKTARNQPLASLLEAYEKELLKEKKQQFGSAPGAIEDLGESLQVSRATLYRKLKKYGLLNGS